MSRHHNSREIRNTQIANKTFENVAKLNISEKRKQIQI
jgi:hypothetical protein